MRHGLLDATSLQQLLYDALDQSDDLVIIAEQISAEAEGLVIASVNDAFCRATGHDYADVIGRPITSLVALDGDPARSAELVRAAQARRSFRSELLCGRKSGPPFWLGLHLMPVGDSTPPCFVLLGRDITESLQARQQQSAVQGLLAQVFLCVKAPVAIVSEAGQLQMTNPALDELLGYRPGALAGRPAIDCVAPAARADLLAARQRQIEHGQPYTLATTLLRADGSEVAVDVTSVVVQRDDLRRFRIVTVLKAPEENRPMTVHVAGKIKLIGLDEVREALGSRWASVAARAMESAEYIIRRRLGPRDTWSRTADGGFLICFGASSEEEAEFQAAMLAREIRSRLVGEGTDATTANVSSVVATVTIPNDPKRSPDALAALISERLNSQLARIEARARETLKQAIQTAACRLEHVRSRRTHEIVALFAQLPHRQEQVILAALFNAAGERASEL